VLFFHFWRIYKTQKVNPSVYGHLFGALNLFCAISVSIYTFFFTFFAENQVGLWIGNMIGEPFQIIGFAYGFGLFFLLVRPEMPYKAITLPVTTFGVLISILAHLIFPFFPEIDSRGILHWNASAIPALNYSIFAFLGLIPLALACIWKGIKYKEVRRRSLLLAIPIFFLTASSVIFSLATTAVFYILALSIQSLGFIFLFFLSFFAIR